MRRKSENRVNGKNCPFFSAARFEMCRKYPNYPLFSSGLKIFVKTPVYKIRDLPPTLGQLHRPPTEATAGAIHGGDP